MKSKAISSLLVLFLCCLNSFAQDRDAVRRDWIAKDTEAIERLLPQLKQIDPTLESLAKVFGREPNELIDLGFGAHTFSFSNAGGYTQLIASGFAFNGKIGHYTIGVHSGLSWLKVRKSIIEAWKANGGFEFKEGESGIDYYQEGPNVLGEYERVVRSELGEIRMVTVGPHLRGAYDYLFSLGNNSVVGSDGCDYAGVVPQGKTAIDQIVKSRRVDLIENILKGYNPGGRIYALLALLEMQRNGVELSADTQSAMRTVLNLDIGIDTCSGCLHTNKTAKQIVDDRQALN